MTMYNLLIGRIDGLAPADRVVEYTDAPILGYIAPFGTVDTSRLVNLPTLILPELQDSGSPQVARVGDIQNLTLVGREYRFRFVQSPSVPAIASARIAEASRALQIAEWEFRRTHWAVKDVDLYRVLQESILGLNLAPQVFRLPVEVLTEQDLVAIMMPFDAGFNDVYAMLQQAVAEAGLRCLRADDVWINSHIMDDVINLIWRARAVISDFTSKNPNVFYETGIAHTLGREVIQITQSMADIPFDLGAIRSIRYLHNNQGLELLKGQIVDRLKYLTTAS
jgi:hypothetical protein